jgi:hypothetical protein
LIAAALVALKWIDPPTTMVQVQRRIEAAIHRRPYRKRYAFVPLGRISKDLQHAFIASQDERFCLSAMAYILVSGLRRRGLAGTELAEAQAPTIRTKLLKIGAQIRVTARKVWAQPEVLLEHKVHAKGLAEPCAKSHPGLIRKAACDQNRPSHKHSLSIREERRKVSDNLLLLRGKPTAKFFAIHGGLALQLREQAQPLDLAMHYRTAPHGQLPELAQAGAHDLLLIRRELAEGLVTLA